jgi:hypothetical protein
METAVSQYMAATKPEVNKQVAQNGVRVSQFSLVDVATGEETLQPVAYQDYELLLQLHFERSVPRCGIVVTLRDDNDNIVSSICTPEEGIGWHSIEHEISLIYDLPQLPLFPGEYRIDLEVYTGDATAIFSRVSSIDVQPTVLPEADSAYRRGHGYFRIAASGRAWVDEQPVHGAFYKVAEMTV